MEHNEMRCDVRVRGLEISRADTGASMCWARLRERHRENVTRKTSFLLRNMDQAAAIGPRFRLGYGRALTI